MLGQEGLTKTGDIMDIRAVVDRLENSRTFGHTQYVDVGRSVAEVHTDIAALIEFAKSQLDGTIPEYERAR